mmetsp:Transcript_34867/g.81483  ORF Transcript_34867/g.81483 Transcript_34867/m.81483 type:complete len:710 (+) Transcript_34867:128-2257(+)|eukprot:CAMPEP_0178389510 /NCGR_PEP_ID=MMETSP0689_2-20121128/10155_1 /TAXON_ID=160604 /ORGANISM="Amphidinium massartii, Strain CS-259" /LENGTH=709 /DNA_ID=CAMNT_0020009965 /DNA_START=58 /DNA_END=2187 /DNA_ORIENTATION=-
MAASGLQIPAGMVPVVDALSTTPFRKCGSSPRHTSTQSTEDFAATPMSPSVIARRMEEIADAHSQVLQASLTATWEMWHDSFLKDVRESMGVQSHSIRQASKGEASSSGRHHPPTLAVCTEQDRSPCDVGCRSPSRSRSRSPCASLASPTPMFASQAEAVWTTSWATNLTASHMMQGSTPLAGGAQYHYNIFSTGSEQRARALAEEKRLSQTSARTIEKDDSLLKAQKASTQKISTTATISTVAARHVSSARETSQLIVQSKTFDIVVGLAILINSVLIGAEVQMVASSLNDTRPVEFVVCQYIFVFVFLVELILRVIAEGPDFLLGRAVLWNLFDSLILLSALFEVVLETMASTEQNTVMGSFLRAMRTVRVVRIIRMWKLKAFEGLRLMVHMIICTFKSLAWSLVLMGVITYIFATSFTQGTAYYFLDYAVEARGTHDEDEEMLRVHFGSIPKSAYFLFSCLLGGESWGRPVLAIAPKLGGAYVVLFLAFMSFSFFAVFNVITSFFCENAFAKVKDDRERVIAEQVRNQAKYVTEFNNIFRSLDSDSAGEITLSDLERNMRKPDFQAYLRHLNLNVDKAWDIFRLVDADRSGAVSSEEFVEGCLRLRGEAKAVDVARLGYEMTKTQDRLSSFIEFTEITLAELARVHQVEVVEPVAVSRYVSKTEWTSCGNEPSEDEGDGKQAIPFERSPRSETAGEEPRLLLPRSL